MTARSSGLHHGQPAVAAGGGLLARESYGGVPAMHELEELPVLAARGGCWSRSGGWEVHLGVATPFVPASKAHPGVLVQDLDALAQRLRSAGAAVQWDHCFPGQGRSCSSDLHGDRLELLEPDRPARAA